jgi:hypothetical protein
VSELDQFIQEDEKKASHVKAANLLQQKPTESVPHSSVELSSFKKITTDVCQQTPNPDIHSAPPQSAVTPPGPSAPLSPNLTKPPKSETGTTLKSKSNNAPLVFHDLQAALRSRRAFFCSLLATFSSENALVSVSF